MTDTSPRATHRAAPCGSDLGGAFFIEAARQAMPAAAFFGAPMRHVEVIIRRRRGTRQRETEVAEYVAERRAADRVNGGLDSFGLPRDPDVREVYLADVRRHGGVRL